MEKYQRCSRCIMDNKTDKTIVFDDDGCCNYCSDALKRQPTEYYPNEYGKRKLEEIINQIKEECKNDKYDCIVGVSGGIDSSYILYLGYQYGLRMLAVHIDDGFDNPIAKKNINQLIRKTDSDLITIKPDKQEYADVIYSLLKASVPGLASPQDNLIIKALQDYGIENKIRYSLDGSNFAHESILERSDGINACDKKHILSIQKKFGTKKIRNIQFTSLWDRYIKRHFQKGFKHIRPLNYIDYTLENAIKELEDFCDFEYYGGKHYESILTRFLQCYYLPVKFGMDKRKSHYSSLIVSNQMDRDTALKKMEEPLYRSDDLLQQDKQFVADFLGITLEELQNCIDLPGKSPKEYPHSFLNELAPLARKFRRIIE